MSGDGDEIGITYRGWIKCGSCAPLRDTPMDLTPERLAALRGTPGVTFHCCVCVELAIMRSKMAAKGSGGNGD